MPPNKDAQRDLDARLLTAHSKGDVSALISLYIEAAECAIGAEAHGFYLTHAYVFALETGDTRAADLRARLVSEGRDR